MAARAAQLILLASLALATACVQDDGRRFNPIRDMATVSLDEEREIGLEFDREIRKHVDVIDDPVVAGFINDLGQEMVRTIEPQPFIYRFRVINDPSLNAFAVPGGYIYFHSGTVLAAGSVDELAGVLGHEIGHVKARHFARMQQKTQIPDLLAGLAGMAAAVASGEPGAMLATQAVNVAMKLQFTREFERESDQLGAVFVTRVGYDPAGITRFFERLLAERRRNPVNFPPYLFSHPDVEDRIDAVEIAAENLRPTRKPPPGYAEALANAQLRIAVLLDTRRDTLPGAGGREDRSHSDPLLDEANRLAAAGDLDQALLVLARAETAEPFDPRISFRIGELLSESGRHSEAVEAFRRTVRLDPTHALVFFKIGESHKELGDRHRAVFAFEQAQLRSGETSAMQRRAEWEIEKLTFPILLETGLADGNADAGSDTPLGRTREDFQLGVDRIAWWGRLSNRFNPYTDLMTVRWTDPEGRVVQEAVVQRYARPYIGSVLELAAPDSAAAGQWTVEARIDDDVLDRLSFPLQASR